MILEKKLKTIAPWFFFLSILLFTGCAPRILDGARTEVDTAGPDLPAEVELLYTFELVRSPFTIAKVTVTTLGTPEGATAFALAERWDGISRFEDEVHGVTVRDGRGEPLSVEHDGVRRWTVEHDPGEPLSLSYYLVSTLHTLTSDSSTYYRPIIRTDLFHMIGNVGLIYPEHLDTVEPRRIEVRWRGFSASGWKTVSSFSADPKRFQVEEVLDDFRHALFLAGDLRIHERKVKGRPVVIALTGSEWGFTDREFTDLAVRIIETERSFFDDFDYPYFLITLIPVGKREPGSFWTGGTGLRQSFALFLPAGLGLEEGSEEAKRIKNLLAHELFHNWNGSKIFLGDTAERGYWFSEGFTNFYTRRLLFRAGLYSLDEYMEDLNEALATYMLSPVRNEPNERIKADFWNDGDVHKLPYLRGDMAAFLIDHEIRRSSSGAKSLDDLMKELLGRATAEGGPVDNDKLLGLIEEFTSPAFTAGIRKIVIDGETAALPLDLLEPCLEMSMEPMGPFDLGFDFEASKEEKIVTGVKEGSSAFQAGLRDGQRLRGWSVHGSRPDREVELKIQDGEEGERTISYLPQGEPIDVPQLSPRESVSDLCQDIL